MSIKCKICRRITKKLEPTGLFITYKKLEKGFRIKEAQIVCMNCNGSKIE